MRAFWIIARIATGIVAIVAILYVAIRIYPTPLMWLLADRDPAILDGHAAWPDTPERNILPVVLRYHPGAATEQGLVEELSREGAKIDRARRSAEIHWISTHCENWLYLDWTVKRDGSMRTLRPDWQAGCD